MDVDQLPEPERLNQLFGDLLDLKTEVFKGKPITIKPNGDPVLVATYISEEDILSCLCVLDIQVANKMGSALTMIPVDMANQGIKEHTISDEIIDNIKEVMNIISSFLNAPNLPHLKLKEVLSSKKPLPDEVTKLMNDPVIKLDLEVNLQNYGQGYMSIILGNVSTATAA